MRLCVLLGRICFPHVTKLVRVFRTQPPELMLPGTTLDRRSYDPSLGDKSMPLSARLGPTERRLLDEMAAQIGVTRSNLARRLLVQALLELRDERRA